MITCLCPYLEYHLKCKTYIKPCANGCNIVGQQLPTLFDVTCCVHLLTVLHVLESCMKHFPTLLFLACQCWMAATELLHTTE